MGKTTYACSSPGKKYLINLDPDGPTAVEYRDDIEIWDYSDWEPEQVIKEFTGGNLGARIDKSSITENDTVIFDSCTVLNQNGLLTAIKQGVGESNKFTPSLATPGLAAYGARTQFMIAAMGAVNRASRRKGAHCWFIAHEDTPERNEKGEFLYQSIMLSENAINQSTAAISEIWRMTERDNSRTVMIRSTGAYKPMGTRMFRTDEKKEYKLKYDIDKPDADQPHAIVNLWNKFIEGGKVKLHVPE